LLALAGCAHPARYTGPGGEAWVDVACAAREDCEAQARALCGGQMMVDHEQDRGRGTEHEVTMTARCVTPLPQTRALHGPRMARSKVGGWCEADSTCEPALVCLHSSPDEGVCAAPPPRAAP
jgi:hypothetical protein